jgi:glycogen(starch) synthase
MRVLLLGPYPPPHGGVQTHLVSIRDYLRSRNVPCAVINITRHRKPEADEVYYPKSSFELLKLLFGLDYDLVHLHFGGNLTPRLLALSFVCSLVPRASTVLTFHSGGYPGSPAGQTAEFWTLRGFVFRRIDRVIGVNRELVDMFHRLGVKGDRARFIQPHAFSAGSIAPETQGGNLPEGLRAFFDAHGPVLLTVGGLETEYALPLQIEMLGCLRETFPDAGLAIVGSGSLEREIRACIDTKAYREHILLCGDVPHAATLNAIAESDLLLRPTLYDGDSIAVREALHLGTPVLATDNGMRPEGVRLISNPTPETLARAVEECLNNRPAGGQPAGDRDDRNLEAILALYAELRPQLGRSLSSSTTVAG